MLHRQSRLHQHSVNNGDGMQRSPLIWTFLAVAAFIRYYPSDLALIDAMPPLTECHFLKIEALYVNEHLNLTRVWHLKLTRFMGVNEEDDWSGQRFRFVCEIGQFLENPGNLTTHFTVEKLVPYFKISKALSTFLQQVQSPLAFERMAA